MEPERGSAPAAVQVLPGRFSDRFVAYLADTIPFAVGSTATIWVWGDPLGRPITNRTLCAIGAAWILLAVAWQFVGNLSGGTPGKKIMGLRVVTADGEFPGAGRSLARALVWLLGTPLANVGFWIALFQPKTRTLHDMASGTFVVEAGPRRSNGALGFLAAVLLLFGVLALQFMVALLTPTPADLAAIAKARHGLGVVAKIEDVYYAKHGVYAGSVSDLAEASGDVELFRSALLDVFSPKPFRLEAGNHAWRVTAAAKDRRHTLVRREGP